MRRVFVCSPLRGPNGQPSEQNIKLAKLLMRAVFDAGHAPFVPHLLYPQVLSESEKDLKLAFEANYAWLRASDELWVYAHNLAQCSGGMRKEVEYAVKFNAAAAWVESLGIRWMPPEFEAVRIAHEHEQLTMTQTIAHCVQCARYTGLNSQKLCIECFAGGSPA